MRIILADVQVSTERNVIRQCFLIGLVRNGKVSPQSNVSLSSTRESSRPLSKYHRDYEIMAKLPGGSGILSLAGNKFR